MESDSRKHKDNTNNINKQDDSYRVNSTEVHTILQLCCVRLLAKIQGREKAHTYVSHFGHFLSLSLYLLH